MLRTHRLLGTKALRPTSLLRLRDSTLRFQRQARLWPLSRNVRLVSTAGANDPKPNNQQANNSSQPAPPTSAPESSPPTAATTTTTTAAAASKPTTARQRLKARGRGAHSSSIPFSPNLPSDPSKPTPTPPPKRSDAPSIPAEFIKTNYISIESNTHDWNSLPYHVHTGIKHEILTTLASCLLTLPPTIASSIDGPASGSEILNRMPAKHNNLILNSPVEGSSVMLESLTLAAAKRIGADVIKVDLQDLMELTAYMFGPKSGNPWPHDHMHRGFNPFAASSLPTAILDDLDDDDDDDDYDDDDGDDNDLFGESDSDEDDSFFGVSGRNDRNRFSRESFRQYSRSRQGGSLLGSKSGAGTNGTEDTLYEKFEKFWTALLLASPMSTPTGSTVEINSGGAKKNEKRPKILFLGDTADLVYTTLGATLLPSLTDAILTLRKAGHSVMAVAGYSPSLLQARESDGDESIGTNKKERSDKGERTLQEEGTAAHQKLATVMATGTTLDLITTLQKLRPSKSDSLSSSSFLTPPTEGLGSLIMDSFPGPTGTFHSISVPPYGFEALEGEHSVIHGNNDKNDADLMKQQSLENIERFKADKRLRIKAINCRNLKTVLQFRGGGSVIRESTVEIFGGLEGIDGEIWGFGKVYRVINLTLGSLHLATQEDRSDGGILSAKTVEEALRTWKENQDLRKRVVEMDRLAKMTGKGTLNETAQKVKDAAAKNHIRQLVNKDDCTRHERRLLGSIIDPALIRTTFSNTIIPAETIHTLQSMISLPLLRPDLFSTGLLKTEFLSGLLLFGPPGTGKTLLAKAVAKESGARMLEIKASDVFDMYVGEGEKNVQAIFSLARKLAPCVIFLDEVDSIFRARGSESSGGSGGGGGASQREILNQFMVEWDGVRSGDGQNQGIVVMASTNRPFELDDAVLRRLPRRMMVDLPTEEARARILKVYLEKEELKDNVDIKDLAKKTKLFSGSDLKNLCVSAALQAVREMVEKEALGDAFVESKAETNLAPSTKPVFDLSPLLRQRTRASSTSESQVAMAGTSSKRSRVLEKRHFDQALNQITPSCSENMQSLTELRKWDVKFGDGGKNRKKPARVLGFESNPVRGKK